MIVEYIRYAIPQARGDAFEAAYARARESLDASPECLGYELSRCTEDPSSYVLRIEWESVEAHLEGFRKGPRFPAFFSAIKPFVSDIVEMRHYALTGVVAWKQPKEASGCGRATMFICGNDDAAKKVVEGVLDDFGWAPEDMGGAEAARAIEPLCMLWCIPGFLRNQWDHAFKLVRRQS